MRRTRLVPLLCGLLSVVTTARGVIVFGTGDEAAHANRPNVTDGAGWDYEGTLGGFLGTPIGPHHFLIAAHVSGGPGQAFVYAGQTYLTVRGYPDPAGSDLFVWEVDGTFPRFAPLFDRPGAEVGQPLYVFGRGAQRGAEVHVPADDATPGILAGWAWGGDGYVQRWGRNVVARVEDGYLVATFDATGTGDSVGDDEAHLSGGDSGGGVFLLDHGAWKLAGINYGVSGGYSYTSDGANPFNAAIFRGNGLYENDGDGRPYVASAGPGLFASTAVATRLGFIRVATGQTPLAQVGDDVLFGFNSESGKSYRVEFCNDLAAGSWTALPGSVAGNGGIVVVTDPGAASQPQRFYRAVTLP